MQVFDPYVQVQVLSTFIWEHSYEYPFISEIAAISCCRFNFPFLISKYLYFYRDYVAG